MKTTIEKGAPLITLINVFTVDPAKQDELIGVLDEATERSSSIVQASYPRTSTGVSMDVMSRITRSGRRAKRWRQCSRALQRRTTSA